MKMLLCGIILCHATFICAVPPQVAGKERVTTRSTSSGRRAAALLPYTKEDDVPQVCSDSCFLGILMILSTTVLRQIFGTDK